MKKYRRPLLTYRNKSILNTVQVRQNIELANDISIPYYVNLQSKCIIQIILRVLNRLLTNFETCSMQSQLIIFYRTSSCVLILTFKSKIWSFRTKGDIQKERQREPDRDKRDIERPMHMEKMFQYLLTLGINRQRDSHTARQRKTDRHRQINRKRQRKIDTWIYTHTLAIYL